MRLQTSVGLAFTLRATRVLSGCGHGTYASRDVCIVQIVVYGFNIYQRWRFRHLPGPRPTWLGGNLDQVHQFVIHACMSLIRHVKAKTVKPVMMQLNVPFDSHIKINEWAQQYGPLFKIFVGHTPVVIVTGNECMLACLYVAQPADMHQCEL